VIEVSITNTARDAKARYFISYLLLAPRDARYYATDIEIDYV
jgi:hypothetical protein